ncbi:response regulator [Actinoplanes sp. NBRC 14428]|uniref:Response regulator RpfG family c-di-GMP phosphodiesterase n=1 Tax=Pseudosporangium ferrugineum TaxID=439699 RepID=A0A2T0SFL2_9ACTN|nr:HD domain-containing phosphohydrolase [Pseudosporangium ferrugineum]PRY32205.1 response regulator RpfG family c-di-GMP phosphodiesterase [Pseudosporangium ferrugineum]BCJ49550.1 response regulator [Actinoplanes sp. NBRC 14428]
MTVPGQRPRILLVDDEASLLDGMRRQLRREFDVETAVGAAKGLFALRRPEPFEVIVSDFLMPGINGAEFLAAARKVAPDSTRMLLTGHTDLEDAAATVNRGQVFRMLLKPVDTETMSAALRDCVAQHRLVRAERELLERTLNGSVKALTDVLSLASPDAFGRANRMSRLASRILDGLSEPVEDRWAVELAVLMSQLGVVSLPPAVATKLTEGAELSTAEQAMVDDLPTVSVQLVSAIPRLAEVAEAIRYSLKNFDGSGRPEDDVREERIPLGGRLIHLLRDYDDLITRGSSHPVAAATLGALAGRYDPDLVAALGEAATDTGDETVRAVALNELRPGMVLAVPVTSRSHVRLVSAGQEVTVGLITRLRNFAALEDGVAEPLVVIGAPDVSVASVPVATG